jgi:hypothetical protein
MKRISALVFLSALAFFGNACEKHPAAELPDEHATEFGKYAAGHGGDTHHQPSPAEHAPAAKPEASAPAAEAKPGEAPKFFPEKK